MGDNVRLGYKLKYPLDMVISEQCIDKYNSIFFFLMKIKRINNVLAILWKFSSSHEFRVRSNRLYVLSANKRRSGVFKNKKGPVAEK